jgi:hypothetical protein
MGMEIDIKKKDIESKKIGGEKMKIVKIRKIAKGTCKCHSSCA